MKRIVAFLFLLAMSAGLVAAQEAYHFDIDVEKGDAHFLSGPEIGGISNGTARLGWAPTPDFALTLSYTVWNGRIAPKDSLGTTFGAAFNAGRPDNEQVKFKDAVLDERDVDMRQGELGLVKSIPLAGSRHWEAYIGVALGAQRSHTKVTWTGFIPPTIDPKLKPEWEETRNEFMLSARGGVRYAIIKPLAVYLNIKWVPIGKLFDQNINSVEANLGITFRFGAFATKPA